MNIKERIAILAKENNTTIRNIEETLGFGRGTISRWSDSSPSIDKLLKVANYFNVNVNVLINDIEEQGYYDDPEVAAYAEELRTNPEMKMLFSAAKDISKESMQKTYEYIKFLKSQERGTDE